MPSLLPSPTKGTGRIEIDPSIWTKCVHTSEPFLVWCTLTKKLMMEWHKQTIRLLPPGRSIYPS